MSCGWQNNCQSRPCNHLQNVAATTYKNILQFYTKKACKKQSAIVDRLTYKAYLIDMEGDSYRLRETLRSNGTDFETVVK